MNTKPRTHCDKCLGLIQDGRCPCGTWVESGNIPFMVTMESAIFAYDHMCEAAQEFSPFSGDHYSGNCILLFKGDYELCIKVKEFIKAQKFIPEVENDF